MCSKWHRAGERPWQVQEVIHVVMNSWYCELSRAEREPLDSRPAWPVLLYKGDLQRQYENNTDQKYLAVVWV